METLLTEDEPAPSVLNGAERARRFRANNRERAYQQKYDYRRRNSKWETDASYLARPFVAWDGEGITDHNGVHRYNLLAVKATTGERDSITDPHGLSTAAVLDFIMAFSEQLPKTAIHVIYGGSYDFNMILRDLPRNAVEALYRRRFVEWNGYRLQWQGGKMFYIARVKDGKKYGRSVTIYDVVSFFQTTFVKACDAYLGDNFAHREMIVANKAARGTFTNDTLATTVEYNDAELDNLLALMVELRLRLNRAGLRPHRWWGPGALATALMQREKVQQHRAQCPDAVAQAARFAYAGGRFEVLRFGHVEQPVWEYDVNSAYPAALRRVPNLAAGTWHYASGDPGPHAFALYHIEYHGTDPRIPGALFRRDPNGTVCYPMNVTGWYWSPEYDVTRDYCERGYGQMRVIECWYFVPDAGAGKPFAFIDAMYEKRRVLKAAKDGAHVAYKLALNSLYGKTAQQVGWAVNPKTKEVRIPSFHQLEWAGYATSFCRARVLTAALQNLPAVVAFETDAVFSSEPLDVPLADHLGDFEETVFTDLTYVQSGTYFAVSEGNEIIKTRGVDKCRCPKDTAECLCGSMTRTRVLAALAEPRAMDRQVTAKLTRFVGAGIALAQNFARWRTWETVEKRITLEPTGKRIHAGCDCMALRYDENGNAIAHGLTLGRWHATVCPMLNDAHSAEYPIAWINPDPAMKELEELRETENEYE